MIAGSLGRRGGEGLIGTVSPWAGVEIGASKRGLAGVASARPPFCPHCYLATGGTGVVVLAEAKLRASPCILRLRSVSI